MSGAHEPRLSRAAAMVADTARSRMLSHLLSGDCATAGELARAASVTPATASGHLARLLDARFVVCEARGRHRYYRLAGPEVAHALEALALVAEQGTRDEAWSRPARQRLREARCCYGHLAGRLGVRLFESLLAQRGLRPAVDGYTLTDEGRGWLAGLGLAPPPPSGRRRYAYACMDWSERRDHLAGQLADALLAQLLERGWLRRGNDRAVELTPTGRQLLLPRLGDES
ncbi:helix-turn-helix transcriptional regulator [uncultured Piscinibacter sp.]|uniref:ArsR/SmtB family transcription factor n=1 Tax=uncultured Piscinibacter sp. TaxID=1131835 RepID=UPI00261F1101|nr:helix-turn-helix domain-containing protein [uncultured Piscinibacter sp.]